MFYWNTKTETGTTFSKELLSGKNIKSIIIATAFISTEGVSLLREAKAAYGMQKKDITLYISSEFSSDKPQELLQQLDDICITRIVFERTFHAKVYLLTGEENKLIFGSANFTSGGMHYNVEFDCIVVPSAEQLTSVRKFLAFCECISIPLTSNIIDYYRENAAEIEELKITQKKLRRKLSGFIYKDDAILPDQYAIDDHYFNYEDYEIFFERNRMLNGSAIQEKRKLVQEKMLRIHEKIYPKVKKLGISCHKRPDNVTSLIIPSVYNHYMVAWMGVRYGKTPKEIDALNYGAEKDDIYGFQKHGCLQFCLVDNGFEVNLFFAVKNDAVDRDYIGENIKKLKPKIEIELEKLQGYGMKWVINDDFTGERFYFDIDTQASSAFFDYFKKYDQPGRESYLLVYYPPDDEVLKTLDDICIEVLETIKLLVPLYNTMVYRPQV
jgi:uncharacterized protein YktB (UPF0637 family)